MSIFEKIGDLFSAEDEEDFEEEEALAPPPSTRRESRRMGLSEDVEPVRREPQPRREYREPVREPLSGLTRAQTGNVISMPGNKNNVLERLTQKFKIVVVEPHSFDECPKLVDSLKTRKPVIINLENIENDTARKIFDFLSGGTYALNGNVQKIAQNIFVFLPENVDVSTGTSEPGAFKYTDD